MSEKSWEVVHRMFVYSVGDDGFEKSHKFEVFVPTKPLTPYYMTITIHDQYGEEVVEEQEFDTLEEAKAFAEKWVPPCSVCFSDPCTCTQPTKISTDTRSVLTANFEDEDLSPIQDLFAGKDYYCEVVFSGKSTKVWSGKIVTYLLLRLKLYGEWSMEYSFAGERVVGKVHTFEGSFDFSVERF